jgi:phage/plasmid-like protein (TIGR03299 family)
MLDTLTKTNTTFLIGNTNKREAAGQPWKYRSDGNNSYTGAIPVEDVQRRLFHWDAIEGQITATAITDDGVTQTVDPDRKAIMRSDNGAILGIFKSGYQIHQYDEWLLNNVANLLDADLVIGSAGLMKEGKSAFVQIELEDTLEIGGIEYRPFLTAATSHDGSLATTYFTGSQVLVCDNAFHLATKNAAEKFSVKHTANSRLRISDAKEALRILHLEAESFAVEVQALTEQVVTDEQWDEFVKAYAGDFENMPEGRTATIAANKAEKLNQLWHQDHRVKPWAGTAWGVHQAVNTFSHHLSGFKSSSTTRGERNMALSLNGGWSKQAELVRNILATV